MLKRFLRQSSPANRPRIAKPNLLQLEDRLVPDANPVLPPDPIPPPANPTPPVVAPPISIDWNADDWSWLYAVPTFDDPDSPIDPETGEAPPEPEVPPPGGFVSFWGRVFAPNDAAPPPPPAYVSTVIPLPPPVASPTPPPPAPAPAPPASIPAAPTPAVYSGYSGTGRNDKWKDHSAEDLIQLTVNRYGDGGATLVRLMFDAGYRVEHGRLGGFGSYSVSGNAIRVYDGHTFQNRTMYDAATALFTALGSIRGEMETARRNRNIDSMKPAPTAATAVLVDSRDRIVTSEDPSGRTLVYYVRTHYYCADDAPRWLGELITVDGFQYVQRGERVVPLATVQERAGFGFGTTRAPRMHTGTRTSRIAPSIWRSRLRNCVCAMSARIDCSPNSGTGTQSRAPAC